MRQGGNQACLPQCEGMAVQLPPSQWGCAAGTSLYTLPMVCMPSMLITKVWVGGRSSSTMYQRRAGAEYRNSATTSPAAAPGKAWAKHHEAREQMYPGTSRVAEQLPSLLMRTPPESAGFEVVGGAGPCATAATCPTCHDIASGISAPPSLGRILGERGPGGAGCIPGTAALPPGLRIS